MLCVRLKMKSHALTVKVLVLACFIAQGCTKNELEWHTEPGFRWAALNVPPKGRTGFKQ